MSDGNLTLDITRHVRHVTEEQAQEIEDGIDNAIVAVTGMLGSGSRTLTPDYAGPWRSDEEQAAATAAGRR